MSGNESSKKLNTLNYWVDIESHSPPNIRTSNFVNKGDFKWNQSISFRRKDEVLWNEPLKKEIENPEDWVHKVFLGIFNTKYVIFEFSTKNKEDLEEMKQFHNTCLVSFMVDGNGQPIKNSLKVPDYLKSIALTTIAEEEKSKNFELKIQDIFATWTHRIKTHEETVSHEDLNLILGKILNELSWSNLQNAFENGEFNSLAYTESLKINKEGFEKKLKFDTDDITSSLIFEDLKKIRQQFSYGQTSPALERYLRDDFEDIKRIDVIKDQEFFKESLHIDKMPMVCWPFTGGYPLVSSQQFAVNKIFNDIEDQSLLSVNGPPGTGKTTLLKDIVANIIFKRADAMLSFKQNPKSAFEKLGETSLKVNSKSIQEIYKLDRTLTGFEIVAASSNNGAVENITKELPLKNEIDEKWHNDLQYIKKIADQVNGQESWGMISASLGNRSNNYNFFSNFLFSKDKTIFDFLNHPNYFIEKRIKWDDACRDFESKKLKVSRLKEKIKYDYKKLESYNEEVEDLSSLKSLILLENEKYKKEQQALFNLKKKITQLKSGAKLKQEQFKKLDKKFKNPSFFNSKEAILKKRDVFKLEYLKYKKALELRIDDFNKLNAQFKEHSKLLKLKQKEYNSKAAKLKELKEIISNSKPNQSMPTDEFWKQDHKKIQKSSPWYSEDLNNARIELFIASLNMHKAFLAENRNVISSNLEIFKKVLNKDFNENSDYTKAVWQTFFLVVPVISTTFSSFGSLFDGMNAESIGWLLIDEAGQATPQAPVGALWRSEKAIFVGDPLQVQPVVQIEDKLSKVLLEKNETSLHWSSTMLSAQEIADRINPFGTEIDLGEKKWVGMPLRVHRRCDNPMFEISNRIAYDNFMIYGKPKARTITDVERVIGKTSWFDVKAEPQGESHWIPDEGMKVIELLSVIMKSKDYEYGVGNMPKLYIITPFKNIASDLRRLLEYKKDLWLPENIDYKTLKEWLDKSIGTIHSFQGGETEIVFLVLGGNTLRPGAIDWVCEEPNILNVATTRAQKAFYVIGNKDVWNSGVFGLIKEFIK
jgi:superfamily I DNA and/or RNA helicase